jgi:hypothetical protein
LDSKEDMVHIIAEDILVHYSYLSQLPNDLLLFRLRAFSALNSLSWLDCDFGLALAQELPSTILQRITCCSGPGTAKVEARGSLKVAGLEYFGFSALLYKLLGPREWLSEYLPHYIHFMDLASTQASHSIMWQSVVCAGYQWVLIPFEIQMPKISFFDLVLCLVSMRNLLCMQGRAY